MLSKTQLSKQSTLMNIEDFKKKCDSSVKENLPETTKPGLKMSKVKQMAMMFNMHISQIMKRDGKYSTLKNEFSPDTKPLPTHHSTTQTDSLSNPRAKSKANLDSNCFVADEILNKTTVKDKAQLYSQYIKDMSKIKPKRTKEDDISTVIPPIPAPRTKFQRNLNSSSTSVKRLKAEATNLVLPARTKSTKDTPEITPPIPAPRKKYVAGASTFSSAQYSEFKESESGCSSLPKTTSNELETAQQNMSNFEKYNDFTKPLKSLRKKKLRRSPACKKDITLNEMKPVVSTDSESDCKRFETKILNENQKEEVHSLRKSKLSYVDSIDNMESSQNETCVNLTQSNRPAKARPFTDSLTDQGFETESNEIDRSNSLPQNLALNLKVEDSTEKHCISIATVPNTAGCNFGFSTPIRAEVQQSFSCTNSAKQQLFSPIDKPLPLKNRRRSLCDSDLQRSSLAMQVIREDLNLEHHEHIITHSTVNKLLTKASDNFKGNVEKTSKFWIKCGDFSVVLDIFYTNAERVQLLYEIFSQTSCDTKDLHFGIDNHKFSVHDSTDREDLTTRLPVVKGSSHYWFSTGDLTIPFSGKYLSSQNIQRLFQFVKASVEETGILVFGVDDIEFSNVPEFWHEQPKYSMESNYSMLVGLQSGSSNGLEGRSKYGWPHLEPVKVTDLDETSYNSEADFEVVESGRLSYSPFGSNHYNLSALDNDDLSMPRNSEVMLSLETYCYGYENESLDKLFENNFNQKEAIPVPEMLKTMESQQHRLSLIQNGLSCYTKPVYPAANSLDDIQGTPEYLPKLKSIVSDINKKFSRNSLKEYSPKQLENYMFFLSRYADVCLNNCQDHMDNVFDALNDYNAVKV